MLLLLIPRVVSIVAKILWCQHNCCKDPCVCVIWFLRDQPSFNSKEMSGGLHRVWSDWNRHGAEIPKPDLPFHHLWNLWAYNPFAPNFCDRPWCVSEGFLTNGCWVCQDLWLGWPHESAVTHDAGGMLKALLPLWSATHIEQQWRMGWLEWIQKSCSAGHRHDLGCKCS